ncbi:gliding motility protein SprC [Flavobacterium tyrosinilyticum]|uniref:gliding motility protein SprC n=1 Tax=Flavobacterium tyrosinilyticum TaxID=1658740 RepID=UPI00202EE917|nr:gliding motility protein SprC [Flavobacterium tyrosinilyticum]MCM0665488.1 gliding motility protein SprC [Flavobacterium tyrosinilyticum]
MIQKITLSFFKVLILFSILLFARSNAYAQTIAPQTFDGLEKLCAGNSFNEFYASFSYIDFPAGTTFVVELSDAAGNFTTPVATTLLQTVDVSATQKTIKYAVPTNLVGSDTYSLRVKSSTGVTSSRFRNSLGNTAFPAYFKPYESSFFINGKTDTAMLCAGGSLTLSVSAETPSPINISNIKYKWYKDDVLIAGQSSKDIVINSTGKYYAEIDYGQCSDVNFSSNRVNVVSSSSGSNVTINSSLGNPFCASGTGTILTATSGNSYAWKKDGVLIAGATNRTYSTNESGVYSVEVDFGGCKATGTIDLKSNSFDASIDAEDGYKLSEGETVTVTITTDAADATYEWYLNDNLIPNETTRSYVVAVKGNYKAKVSLASGCVSSKEFTFKINGDSGPSSVIPNIIKLSGMNPYWNIPDEYKNANTKVMIISSNGDMVLDVMNYQGDWPQNNVDFKNVNPVYYYVIQSDTGEKKGSITVIK